MIKPRTGQIYRKGTLNMSNQPQQSLRKHRQTLVPGALPASSKKSYGQLDAMKAQLPSVASKDREKVGNMVKKRFSSRVQADNIYKLDEVVPPLPSNAFAMIEERTLPREKGSVADIRQPDIPPRQADSRDSRLRSASIHSSAAQSRADTSTVGVEREGMRSHGEIERHGHEVKRSEQSQIQTDPFLSKTFDAKVFISENLSSATDKEISTFADDLHSKQEQLKIDRKEALYQNYKTFLNVGSQISKFGTEAESLRKLVSDLKEAMTAMIDDAELAVAYSNGNSNSNGSKADLRRTGSRNSVIMLEKMWADELGSLFRHVEGAQQYLPVIPGRHVVTESGGWYQLNSATWQPIQPIHIFLLNDHLLIATKKRTRAKGNEASLQANKRLVAENCWPLEEINLIDISKADELDSSMSKYTKQTICIKTGSSAFVYRAEKAEAHRRVMTEFNQTKSELSKLQSGISSRTHSRTASSSGEFSRSSTNRSVSEMAGEKINDVATTLQDLKEVDNIISELDINIAYRKFDEAVGLIEDNLQKLQKEGRYHVKGKSASGEIIIPSEMFKEKLDQRITELCSLMLTELSQDYLSRNQIQLTVKLLNRLNAQERAKKTFLESRKAQLQRRIKQVEFHGDIVNYIRQIVIIYFRMISSCVEIFLTCFDRNEHASSVVQWATEQIDAYGILFSRQLYNISPTSSTYQKCVEITKDQMSQLEKFGLDFGFRLKFIYDNGAA